MTTPDKDKALVSYNQNTGKPNQNEALVYTKPSGYKLSDYPGIAPKEARIAIKKKLDGMTIAVQVAPLVASDLPAAAGELVGPAADSGVVFVNAFNDGTDNSWEILHGQPVVFDTVTGRGVTGINPKWSRSEYKIVGTAWKSHRDKGWARIPVKIHSFEYDPDYTYCAIPVCGASIPARSGNTPGKYESCIFTLQAGKLVPVMIPNLTGGQEQLREDVYNVRDKAIPASQPPKEKYILVHEMAGYLVAESPEEAAVSSGNTPTTLRPETVTNVAIALCGGKCKFVWSSSQNRWNPSPSETTCGSSTSSSTSSTTTEYPGQVIECKCPVTTANPNISTSSTSSTTGEPTSSTTSTTPYPCNCEYPRYCGTTSGECTFTNCVYGEKIPTYQESKDCTTTSSTTSSTTCNCNTTTTYSPECQSCQVFNHPLLGNSSIDESKCRGEGCYCDGMSSNPDICTVVSVPCRKSPPAQNIPCHGKCKFMCVPTDASLTKWVWDDIGFNCGGGYRCSCPAPTIECDKCGATTETQCQEYDVPPNPHSCQNCYSSSSTSSTTTSQNPCGTGCIWKGESPDSWSKKAHNCGGCFCQEPPFNPSQYSCETAHTPCVENPPPSTSSTSTSSSSSSTSSTTTATPWYCLSLSEPGCSGELTCLQVSADDLPWSCQGPFLSEGQCVTSCLSSTTSTSTTQAPWKCCKRIETGGCSPSNLEEYCVQSPVTCLPNFIQCSTHSNEAACISACNPVSTSSTSSSSSTTTCNPLVPCDTVSCVMACQFDTSLFKLIRNCELFGSGVGNCICNPTDEELALENTPCNNSDDNFTVPCCNTCNLPGNVAPCATTTTTTTPAP